MKLCANTWKCAQGKLRCCLGSGSAKGGKLNKIVGAKFQRESQSLKELEASMVISQNVLMMSKGALMFICLNLWFST